MSRIEESVIRGIDLSAWRPWVIIAESTKPRSTEQVHHGWEPLLLQSGYVFCLFDGLNRYYLAQEHEELAELLSFPPSVFDQPYVTPSHAKLLTLYAETLQSYTQQTLKLEQTVASFADLEALHQATTASWDELDREHQRVVASSGRARRGVQERAREA